MSFCCGRDGWVEIGLLSCDVLANCPTPLMNFKVPYFRNPVFLLEEVLIESS